MIAANTAGLSLLSVFVGPVSLERRFGPKY